MLYKDKLSQWLEKEKVYAKYSTYTNYFNIAVNQILPDLGEFDEADLTDEILQEFILDKLDHGRLDGSGGISQKYAKDIIAVLKLSIGHPVNIQLPYCPPKEVEIFDRNELVSLINHLQSEISNRHLGILLAIHTGVRIGELCALTWSDLNFDARLLRINKTMIRTYTKADGSRLNVTPPKSRSSIRTIPLNQTVMHYASLLKGDPDEFIVSGRRKSIEPNKYRLIYNNVLRGLNIPHRKFHSLRHSFATRCLECGCDYKSLSQILGHSNVAITMNLYVHPQMELKRKCVELLDEYYRD